MTDGVYVALAVTVLAAYNWVALHYGWWPYG